MAQQANQPSDPSAAPATRGYLKPHVSLRPDLLPELRRYLMLRPVLAAGIAVLLLLHLILPAIFDLATLLLVACLYLLFIGSGGLEAARLSGTGGDARRQERLAEDALRRAGRLQSHLDPCSATDDVLNRILAGSNEPRRIVIAAATEVEDALRAVYRHYSGAERMAGTSSGADLPLTFLVQELIWRGLLNVDINDTAEPILAMREVALTPRAQIEPQVASGIALAAQAVVLRVQSLGIEIHPRRVPLAWLRNDPPADAPLPPPAPPQQETASYGDEDGQVVDGDLLDGPMIREIKEPVSPEPSRRDSRVRQLNVESSDAARP